MIHRFMETYRRLIESTRHLQHRYIYHRFNTENRLTGLIGPRGTGKTTLLLQYINEKIENKSQCIYVSVDHLYFSTHLLMDFVDDLYEEFGVRYFFLDEIHKYPNWNQEIKNIYDAYPNIKIIFSGSSSMDLIKGTHDLSRRGVIYRMSGMSFREYLLFNGIADTGFFTLEQILEKKEQIQSDLGGIPKLKGHFKQYLGCGYYPYFLEDAKTYHQKIIRVIQKTIYEDIANFYKLKTENLSSFKRILSYLATTPPGELNKNSIAKHIGLDSKTIHNYLEMLEETGMVERVSKNRAGSNLLKHTEKIYLDNPDLYHAIISEIGYESKTETIREIFFIKMLKNSGENPCYSPVGDFEVNKNVFEIGGRSKIGKQIKHLQDKAYLVKDDILYGSRRKIPLYLFGFLY